MPSSAVIRTAALYDVGVWLMTFGRARRLRERMLAPARLQQGDAVLDVGCGTGTMALLAKARVGDGIVAGIDASHEMITRARRKADRAQLAVHFKLASADSLPFPDAHFDVALCAVTLHHLPRWMRVAAASEMRRVLRPGGRVLLIDFVFGARRSLVGWLHHQHGLEPNDLVNLAAGAGLQVVEQHPLGVWDLQYVIAVA